MILRILVLSLLIWPSLVPAQELYHTNDPIADSLFWLSSRLLYNSQLQEALLEAKNIIECCPLNYGRKVDAYIIKASIFRQSGNFNEAIRSLDSAEFTVDHFIEIADHRKVNVLCERASVLLMQYKTEEAEMLIPDIDAASKLFEPEPDQVLRILNLKGSIAYQMENWDESLDYFRQLLSKLSNPVSHNDSIQVFNAINSFGNIYFFRGQYFSALEQYLKALELSENIYGAESITVAQSLFNVGLIYSILGYYSEAAVNYNQSLKLRKMLQGEDHYIVSEIYKEFAINYQEQKDFEHALTYYLKALAIREKLGFVGDPVLLNLYIETAAAFMHTGQPAIALDYIAKAESTLHETTGGFQIASFHRSVADIYLETEEYELAALHLNKSLIYFKLQGGNDLVLADIYLQLSKVYLATSLNNQALTFLQQAVSLSEPFGKFQPVYLESMVLLIDHLIMLGEYNAAVHLCDNIFIRYDIGWEDVNTEVFPYPEYLLAVLSSRIKIAPFLEPNETELIHWINTGKQLVNRYRNQSVFESTQLSWLSKARSFYENVFSIAYHKYCNSYSLFWLDLAFEVSESAKSIRLLNHLTARSLHQHFGIPESLFRREQDLKHRLKEANRIFNELAETGESAPTSGLPKIAIQKHNLSDSLRAIQTHIKNHYPEYHNLVYGQSFAGTKDIMSKLDDSSLMLNYFMANGELYAIAITKTGLEFMNLTDEHTLRSQVLKLREQLMIIGETAQFSETLSEILIFPFASQINLSEKLIVIPDDLLFYLPFDLLYTKDLSSSQPVFLHYNMTIAYQQSAMLWDMYLEEQSPSSPVLAAFAPWFDDHNVNAERSAGEVFWPPLKYALEEATYISRLFNGSVYRETGASKSVFLESLGRYNIIHVATHASFNDQDPGLSQMIFRCHDGTYYCVDPIYAKDIFHLQTEAGLVVLSACNTGVGRIYRGDGISSLATAFQYAGAKNVVLSLWPVPDLSTGLFMEYFYAALHSGMSIERALQHAKISVQNHAPQFAHPIHWAGFQVYGASHFSFNPDQKPSGTSMFWGVIILISMFCLYSFWRFGRHRAESK